MSVLIHSNEISGSGQGQIPVAERPRFAFLHSWLPSAYLYPRRNGSGEEGNSSEQCHKFGLPFCVRFGE